jgi:hypothetical protein
MSGNKGGRICVCLLLLLLPAIAPAQGKRNDPRNAVETFFKLLKTQNYQALYNFLPAEFQQHTSREQLAMSLKRLDGFLTIEKLEIGRVQLRDAQAVVDTVIYGRLKQPRKIQDVEIREGRVQVQQFLLRENNQWKLATADNRSQNYFLKRNPEFSKQFQLAPPRLEFKRDGKWEAAGMRR